MQVSEIFHVIMKRGPYYGRRLRMTKKAPVLRAGEVAIKIRLDFDDAIWEPRTVPIVVKDEHVLRPKIEGRQE